MAALRVGTEATQRPPSACARGGRGPLERFLGLFAETKDGEGPTAVLLTLSVFLLLTCYYLLKTAREPLILESGAEIKSYSSAGQALLLIPTTYLYGLLARHVGRIRLITAVTLVFASNLVVFFALHAAGARIGVPFFLWVGVFNMMIVAQFWSFAADVYTEEQGKRLFAIVGIGSTVGAVAGSGLAGLLIRPIGVYGLMLTAIVFLLASLALLRIVHHRTKNGDAAKRSETNEPAQGGADAPLGKKGGFALLLGDRYLLLIAALAFLLNCVNTNGEYILDRTLVQHVKELVPPGADTHAFSDQYIGTFKAHYFLYVNSATVVLQLFVVSRIIRYVGVRVALFIAPVISLIGYSTLLLAPVLGIIFAVKISENTLDYSLQNTARQALWLSTSRDEKYKSKSVIDALLVRCGDFLSAAITMVGTALQFATVHFVVVNVVLVCCWLTTLVFLAREQKRREAKGSGVTGEDVEARPPQRAGGGETAAYGSRAAMGKPAT